MTNLKKKLNKRWGKKFKDNRKWPEYNEQLVKRGEFLLALDFVDDWNSELGRMNACKVGKPFRFPNTLNRTASSLACEANCLSHD